MLMKYAHCIERVTLSHAKLKKKKNLHSVSLAGPEEHVDILVASHGNVHAEENQQNEPNW